MQKTIWLFSALAGCTGDGNTRSGESGDPGDAPMVSASIQVLDPMDGGGWEGITVTGGSPEVQTQVGGTAETDVFAEEKFHLGLAADGILDHILYGAAGTDDFELITFAGSPSTSDAVLGMLGLSWQSDSGMLVVGVDYSDWSAVVEAQISVSDPAAQAFVLGAGGMPALGDTIPEGGMGMVSFVNVGAGEVSVELTPPEDVDCTPYPGGDGYSSVTVQASTVTVVSYRCEPGPT